ncbi:DUF2252 domain-containing protein [Streptomyces sp. LX-29]|uniref:DUF2252 domain-containing protein n=1 Tax=Streptomyces sp. LX-29 TaxID=2900152 RepID=UPI00240DE491|nr:DUF2252 domain-containing protein [Streptomyces sp. LX-29]WFB11690.1 DUF2252 domain-containing protein [Streptomyces sp. LX-29]
MRATPSERTAWGRSVRALVPRSAMGEFTPSTRREDPVAVVERQSALRVPELVPIRYGRMLESPFRFYRGAAAIMAGDLGAAPHTGITVQLCGDAHMLNFRLLGSAERRLVFDINDFDETLPGPWEWDVKRLAASLVIAGRGNGFTDAERAEIVRACAHAYRTWMRRFATMGNLAVWYTQAEAERLDGLLTQPGTGLGKRGRRQLARTVEAARRNDNVHAYHQLTGVVDGARRILADPPLITPLSELLPDLEREALEERLHGLLTDYRLTLPSHRRHLLDQFQLVDMARKVVGVGSVGTRCWILLLLGRDDEDPLLLQAKEADTSVLAPYAGPSVHENQGQRVVAGQRLMQAAGDIFLGWDRVEGIDGRRRDFYVRQLRDWKAIAQVEAMHPAGMGFFGQLCGATLARAHARSGDRIAIAAYLGSGDAFDRALPDFAEAYADQNERDHAALAAAARAGRVPHADPE